MAEQSVSILTPLAYVTVLVSALVIFSKRHHNKKLQKLAETPQFFPYNFPRDIYYELKEKPNLPPKVIKAALLSWIAEIISRGMVFQQYAQPVANLLQSGLIDEDTSEQFSGSVKLANEEMMEAVNEARGMTGIELAPICGKEIALSSAILKRVEQLGILKNEYYEIVGEKKLDQSEIDVSGISLPSF